MSIFTTPKTHVQWNPFILSEEETTVERKRGKLWILKSELKDSEWRQQPSSFPSALLSKQQTELWYLFLMTHALLLRIRHLKITRKAQDAHRDCKYEQNLMIVLLVSSVLWFSSLLDFFMAPRFFQRADSTIRLFKKIVSALLAFYFPHVPFSLLFQHHFKYSLKYNQSLWPYN